MMIHIEPNILNNLYKMFTPACMIGNHIQSAIVTNYAVSNAKRSIVDLFLLITDTNL